MTPPSTAVPSIDIDPDDATGVRLSGEWTIGHADAISAALRTVPDTARRLDATAVSRLDSLGVLQLLCLGLYLLPQTSVLGAVLWTGYLGGAVATHVRLGNPLFSHSLFPVYVGGLLWLGLWLRDVRVRQVLPLTTARS